MVYIENENKMFHKFYIVYFFLHFSDYLAVDLVALRTLLTIFCSSIRKALTILKIKEKEQV